MIRVLDLFDRDIGSIREHSVPKISQQLDSWDELSFTVPVTSVYKSLLQNEFRLIYLGEPYVIKTVQPSRNNDGALEFSVTAPSIAIDLNHKPRQVVGTYIGAEAYSNWEGLHPYSVGDYMKYYGIVYKCITAHTSASNLTAGQWVYWTTADIQRELAELVLQVTDMMVIALEDTGWTVGTVDDTGAARTFSGEWLSVPSLLQDIAEKFDLHIVYHGSTKTIDMVKEPGVDNGVTIEYGKNLTGIKKSSDSTSFVTKLFVYGYEDLTINNVNIHGSGESLLDQMQDGASFITDFSFFLAQGYTEDDIYQSIQELGDSSPFLRIDKLSLDDYVDEAQLMAEGRKQLQEDFCKPVVSYSVEFANLADLVVEAPDGEAIGLGDWVIVRDLELGVDVKARVVSLSITPGIPEKSSCELSNKDDFFANAITSAVEYNSKLSQTPAVSDLMKGYINTFTTLINSGNGALKWDDGQLTAVQLDVSGNPTGYQVRLTPTGLGVSTDFGVTYANAITGEGVLANRVIADSLRILNIGSDGIVIEPNSCGVRLNNTEGISVQSEDKRFKTTMKAQNTMSGDSYGFGIWNGDFDEYGAYTGDSLVFGVNMNGHGYFKGTINASDGEFTGTVNATSGTFSGVVRATDFQDASGVSLLTNGKWNSNMLNLGNISLNGDTGDVTIGGNITLGGNINLSSGAITWSSTNTPVQYQFSADNVNWHSTMTPSDKYRKDSLDGGTTWSASYQFVGVDGLPGAPGDDASVPGYIHSLYIGPTIIKSPTIQANILQITAPDDNNDPSGIEFGGGYGGQLYTMFRISYFEGEAAYVNFESPAYAFANWRFPYTYFTGVVDFSGADVRGITATFA